MDISLDEGNSSRQELERSNFELDCECCYSIYRDKVVNQLEKDESYTSASRNAKKFKAITEGTYFSEFNVICRDFPSARTFL